MEGSSRKGRKPEERRLLEDDAVLDFTCSATHGSESLSLAGMMRGERLVALD